MKEIDPSLNINYCNCKLSVFIKKVSLKNNRKILVLSFKVTYSFFWFYRDRNSWLEVMLEKNCGQISFRLKKSGFNLKNKIPKFLFLGLYLEWKRLNISKNIIRSFKVLFSQYRSLNALWLNVCTKSWWQYSFCYPYI